MSTSYHIFTTGSEPVAKRARKDAAIKYADLLMEPYRIVTDSGKIVHEVHEVTVTGGNGPTEEPAEETAPNPEPTEEPTASEEPAEEDEEDLIGVPVDEPRAKEPRSLADAKRKIAKLLAKAERTDNEHERDTFNAKAEKLMLQLGIDVAELEAAGEVKPEEIIEERIHWANVYAKNLVEFATRICGGIGNLTNLQSGSWANATVYIIGHRSDVELAVQLIKSLEVQAFSAMEVWRKANKEERRGMSNYDRLVANRSFLAGFASTVAHRISVERREVEETASAGAALVLASKMDRVVAARDEMYPKLGKARQSGNGKYSSLAAQAGRLAGQTADIGHKRVGGKKGELA